ncbi:MAG TPA: acyltransferase, partial [Chroococcales cyanobacterium]
YAILAQGQLVLPLNPLWSLCIEEQFYIVWGMVMWRVKRLQTMLSLIAAGLIATVAIRTISFIVAPGNHLAFYVNGPARMDSILMGAAAAFLWNRCSNEIIGSRKIQAALFAASFLILTGVVSFLPPIEKCDISAIWAMSAIAVAWTCFLLATLSNDWLRRFFSLGILTHVGKLTYGLYIFHVVVLASLILMARAWFDIQTQGQFVFICWVFGLALTYGLARLSWRFIEKPCCDLKDRFSHQSSS